MANGENANQSEGDGAGGGGSGGGDNRGGDNRGNDNRGGRRPGEGPQIPEIEELMKKGTEQLRVLMGGRGNRGTGGGGPPTPLFTRRNIGFGVLALFALWLYASVYTVKPEERSVELTFGSFSGAFAQSSGDGISGLMQLAYRHHAANRLAEAEKIGAAIDRAR